MKSFLTLGISLLTFVGCRTTALAFQSLSKNRRGVVPNNKTCCDNNNEKYYHHHHHAASRSPARSSTTAVFTLSLSSSFKNNNNDEQQQQQQQRQQQDNAVSLEKIELTNEKIAEMLEVTFIKACLQLATGYVDILKLFVAAVNAAYNRGIPIPTLIDLVAQCPNNTANRDLSKEEIELRSSWMIVSYLTLETIDRLEGKGKGEESKVAQRELQIPVEARDEFGVIIQEQVQREMGLVQDGNSSIHDEAVGQAKESTNIQEPQKAAMFAYCLKVISLTISNVKETRLANEKTPSIDEDGVGPPRPKIPGTY
mmetsp:Transcript_10639/g.19877  ORF Transcript_10639/g.19877 Transcript_10639/m.19877 type:complete len:311 (+) Transcript_10639:107-1039(+)